MILIFFALSVGLASVSMLRVHEDFAWVLHTQSVLRCLADLERDLYSADSASRAYVLTGAATFKDGFERSLTLLPGDLKEIQDLVRDNLDQTRTLAEVERALDIKMASMAESVRLKARGQSGRAAALVLQSRTKGEGDAVRGQLRALEHEETGLLSVRDRDTQRQVFIGLLAWGASSAACLLTLLYLMRVQRQNLDAEAAAAEVLKDSEERFRAFTDNSPLVAFLKDKNGALRWGNRAFRRLSGSENGRAWRELKVATELSRPADGVSAEVSDNAALEGLATEYLSVQEDGAGRKRHWITIKFPVKVKGETLIGVKCMDVTDREQMEARLRESEATFAAFMSNSPMGAYLRRRGGEFIWANRAYHGAQRKPIADLKGLHVRDITDSPEVAEALLAGDRKVLDEGRPIEELLTVPASDGRLEEDYLSLKFPVQLQGETVVGGLILDVSERRAAERLALAYTRELERSNRELQVFASVAAHDLQEPLRKIRAFGDLLQAEIGESLAPDAAEYLARMQGSAGRMQALIEDLLSYSRVNSQAGDFSQVDMKKTLDDVLADLELAIAQGGVLVESGPLPKLKADATQMRQLIQNLVANAVKFRRSDARPRIMVSAQDKGSHWEFCVRDNGIGFDMRHADKIFNLFQRLNGRDAYEGNGVGLAVCRKIAERHGGSIRTESELGKGAAFFVSLPKEPSVLKGNT